MSTAESFNKAIDQRAQKIAKREAVLGEARSFLIMYFLKHDPEQLECIEALLELSIHAFKEHLAVSLFHKIGDELRAKKLHNKPGAVCFDLPEQFKEQALNLITEMPEPGLFLAGLAINEYQRGMSMLLNQQAAEQREVSEALAGITRQ